MATSLRCVHTLVIVRHNLVQPGTILVIFIYRITLSYEDQQVLRTRRGGKAVVMVASGSAAPQCNDGHRGDTSPRFVVSLSHIILSRLGAHILTGTLLDRHARQHLGEQSCTNPLSFSFSPDCSLVASTTTLSLQYATLLVIGDFTLLMIYSEILTKWVCLSSSEEAE